MNGISEPLPGLLDDPQFAITDLPALTDFHIAPLRDPAPLKHINVPSPLEPVTANAINSSRSSRHTPRRDGLRDAKRTPKITPSEVLLARESKKPHLAISELLEDADTPPQHLPSFISLSVVEKSPISAPSLLEHPPTHKRPRLELDGEYSTHDVGRQLPRPSQKETPISRPAPLLPAMVTGLHEPPPSAALLPSMDLDLRPGKTRASGSKIQVKDILRDAQSKSPSPDVSKRTGTTSYCPQPQPVQPDLDRFERPLVDELSQPSMPDSTAASFSKDPKARRARRKWTDPETQHLLAGVRRYGIGKWKQILDDPAYSFTERSSVDLKDRFRVCSKDDSVSSVTASSTPSLTEPTPIPKAIADRSKPGCPPPHLTSVNPAVNKQRRKRRAWSCVEDAALLQGVAKHGFQWTAIHADPDLDLAHRRATDLRDRIRNKFPEGYKHAESAPVRSNARRAEKDKYREYLDAELGLQAMEKDKGAPDREGEKYKDFEKEREPEKSGVTLPSLTLDDDDMDWDNRLPPLLPWDEIG